MSYILDALKRADAEREQGHVPGLHTRNLPGLAPPAARRRGKAGPLLLGGALLLVVATAVWWWAQPAPIAPTPTELTTAPMPAPEPAAPAAPPPAEPAGTIADSAATLPALPILAPEPPRSPRAPAKSEPAKVATSPTTAPAPTTATTAATAAPANPVRSFAELTPEARARLPVVNVSGSTYSQNPAHRMLIINGKVVQEGAEIAPGLTLETIEQRSAVLNHQGLRYRIGY